LSSAEREALEHGGRLHLVSHYAGSLRVLDWNYKTHPPFRRLRLRTPYQHTPDYLRNDPELLQEFPPRPLAGIDKGLGWNSPETITVIGTTSLAPSSIGATAAPPRPRCGKCSIPRLRVLQA
jgi:hypothetical protein